VWFRDVVLLRARNRRNIDVLLSRVELVGFSSTLSSGGGCRCPDVRGCACIALTVASGEMKGRRCCLEGWQISRILCLLRGTESLQEMLVGRDIGGGGQRMSQVSQVVKTGVSRLELVGEPEKMCRVVVR